MSKLIRVPDDSAREIESIAKEYGVSIASAFQIWKKRKLGIKWE